ncbi:MAG: ferrous iron transport protein A [Candidatus Cloacimonetes bacterium HGW-Cloacimonetes-1]|nr:MAG: ferrous iron transport protein A [Candidatus Cloacimonetes bacterium HGW-Cloacimonetes-1]
MLSNRHRARLRGFGRKLFNTKKHCKRFDGDCLSLADVPEPMHATIYCNGDITTIERGLYLGVMIKVLRNDITEPNIIVAVGDARYVLDRRVANKIRVRIGD